MELTPPLYTSDFIHCLLRIEQFPNTKLAHVGASGHGLLKKLRICFAWSIILIEIMQNPLLSFKLLNCQLI